MKPIYTDMTINSQHHRAITVAAVLSAYIFCLPFVYSPGEVIFFWIFLNELLRQHLHLNYSYHSFACVIIYKFLIMLFSI